LGDGVVLKGYEDLTRPSNDWQINWGQCQINWGQCNVKYVLHLLALKLHRPLQWLDYLELDR
jgi:hypothetical protein